MQRVLIRMSKMDEKNENLDIFEDDKRMKYF